MKYELKTVCVVVAISSFAIWMFVNRAKTTWHEETPYWLNGTWGLIKDSYSDNYGMRTITLRSNSITIYSVIDEGEEKTENHPIKSCSLTTKDVDESGEVVVFYGEDDKKTKTKYRLKIHYDRKQKIFVQEIIPTGIGENRYFSVGEFVKFN
jgi:hypothetical protein